MTEAEIDRLRLKAFKSNAYDDRQAYFEAAAKWFQDRHYRSSTAPAGDGAALSKEVQASEAVAFADPKGNLLIPEGSPLIEMLKSLPDGPFGGEVCPLFATPQPLPATDRGAITEAMVGAALAAWNNDCLNGPPEQDERSAMRCALTAALSVPAPGTDIRQVIFDALDLSEELRVECTADVVSALTAAGFLASTPVGEGKQP